MSHVRERVEVEPERVRSGRLGGVPPQLAHHGEVDAGLDALHVGEDHGRDIQAWIEDRTVRIGNPDAPKPTDDPSNYADECDSAEPGAAGSGRHGRARGRVSVRRGFFSWAFFLGVDTTLLGPGRIFERQHSRHTFYWHRRARLDDRAQVVDSRGAASPRVAQSVQARWRRVAGNAPR